MAKRGRKVKYTKARIEEIRILLEDYIIKTDIPIVAEFAYLNDIPRQKLYEIPELNDTIKKLIDKKESVLEKKGLKGEVNSTMAVFSLKQLGWKDKQEVEHSNKEDKSLKIEFV